MNFTGKTVINNMRSLKKILKQFVSVANDNLETLIISNIGWFAFCSPIILIQFYFIKSNNLNILWAITTFITFLLIPATTAGLFYLCRIILIHHDAEFKDFLKGIKKYFAKSIIIASLDILILLVLSINLSFYLEMLPALSGASRYFVLATVGFIIWGLFFSLISQVYIFPVMVKENISVFNILKNAFLLSINNILLSITVFVIIIILSSLWIISGLGVLCFLGITAGLLGTVTLDELIKQPLKEDAN